MKLKLKSRKNRYLPLIIIAAVLLLGQLLLDIHFWRNNQFANATEPITSMIIQAVQAVNKPAVIEPLSGQVYLPDAKLVLPAPSQGLPDLLYTYSPSIGSTDAEASVTVTNAVSVGISKLRNAEGTAQQQHDLNRLFDAVPGLQVCSRGVHLVFGHHTQYTHLQFTKQLADGRPIYVYTEQQTCAYDLTPLITYLRDTQSY